MKLTVHVCAPPAAEAKIFRQKCPTCERRVYFVGFFTPWYGWSKTCLRCGEQWEDGERMDRPLMRGWREKSKVRARARFRRFRENRRADD